MSLNTVHIAHLLLDDTPVGGMALYSSLLGEKNKRTVVKCGVEENKETHRVALTFS